MLKASTPALKALGAIASHATGPDRLELRHSILSALILAVEQALESVYKLIEPEQSIPISPNGRPSMPMPQHSPSMSGQQTHSASDGAQARLDTGAANLGRSSELPTAASSQSEGSAETGFSLHSPWVCSLLHTLAGEVLPACSADLSSVAPERREGARSQDRSQEDVAAADLESLQQQLVVGLLTHVTHCARVNLAVKLEHDFEEKFPGVRLLQSKSSLVMMGFRVSPGECDE